MKLEEAKKDLLKRKYKKCYDCSHRDLSYTGSMIMCKVYDDIMGTGFLLDYFKIKSCKYKEKVKQEI